MSSPRRSGNGISAGMVMFTVFLSLKLAGVIGWSWWWVTAPIWAPVTFAVMLIGIAGVITGWANRETDR